MYVYCSIVASSSICGARESDGYLKVSRKSPTELSSSKQVTLEAALCRAQPLAGSGNRKRNWNEQ